MRRGPEAIAAARASAEGTGGSQRADASVVIAEHVGQHLVGVLADGRCLRWHGQLLAHQLDRRRELVGAELLAGQPRQPLPELGVVGNGARRVDGSDRRVAAVAERYPLGGGPTPEDGCELGAQLRVPAAWSA